MNIFVSDGKVLSQDRAFNYGDGIFTTTHVQHGKIQLFDFHLSRLAHDASVLNTALDMKALSDAMVKTAKAESRQSFVLKVHVSAGEGGRGYARDKANPALIRLMCFPYPQHTNHYGRKAQISFVRRPLCRFNLCWLGLNILIV